MKIENLNKKNKDLWENFIKKNKDSKIQHTLGWKNVIENTYPNCKPKYHIGLEKNRVKFIIPFFLVKSKLWGDKLISVPFLDNGGFLGKLNEKDIESLLKKRRGKNKIQIKMNSLMENFDVYKKNLIKKGFREDKSKQQFIVNLQSKEKMWDNFHKHTRNDIRKAIKSGLKVKKIKDEKEIKKFYDLYFKNMKYFGTPQHSYKFFKNMSKFMKKNSIGFNCYYGTNLASSIIFLYVNKNGYIAFNVSDIKYRKYRPNDLLYWETIKWALKNKINKIDLGQVDANSKDSRAIGLYKFKRKWLGKVCDKYSFNYPISNQEKKKKEKLKKFRSFWRKLPSPLIKIIGPKINSELGI